MSSQSGIIASQDLVDSFKQFTDGNDRFLLVRIDNETLVVHGTVPTAGSLVQDFESLHQTLTDDQSLFIIARKPDSDQYAFISYVPDNSSVKDKMVYASTKNTVLRNLGLEYFDPILFADHPNEISGDGWQQIEAAETAAKPLTDEERSWEKVKADELYATKRQSLARQDSSKGINFDLGASLQSTLADPSKLDDTLVVFGIQDEKLQLDTTYKLTDPATQLVSKLGTDAPSYNLVGYHGDFYFIYCCPSGSKVRDRMQYATERLSLTKSLEKLGYKLKETVEIGDPDELDLSIFTSEPAATTASAAKPQRFSRPKGPRRR